MTYKEPLNIQIPALKRPTLKQIQQECSWIKSIERDTSITEATDFSLYTVLEDGESYAEGSDYESRLPKEGLGFQHAQWLVAHQDEHPAFKALLKEWIYIDFPGLVVVGSDGNRCLACVSDDGGRFMLGWDRIDGGFSRSGRVGAPAREVVTGPSDPLPLVPRLVLELGGKRYEAILTEMPTP